jgi:hypothetical protein
MGGACCTRDRNDKCIQNLATRFEAFTAVKIQVEVFWAVTPCSPHPQGEDGGSMNL